MEAANKAVQLALPAILMVGRAGPLLQRFVRHARQKFVPARIFCISGYNDPLCDWTP